MPAGIGVFVARILHQGAPVCLVLVPLATLLLIAVFALGWDESPLAGGVFALSFYALILVVAALVRRLRALRDMASGNARISRFLGDYAYRTGLGLYAGLGVNLCFAALKLLTGWAYRSAWLSAAGAYYLILAVMRFGLLWGARTSGRMPESQRQCQGRLAYLRTGWLMFVLGVAMSAMIVQMVRDGRTYSYPGVVIYAMAAYVFYSLTVAAINLARRRRERDWLLAAARCVSLACAVMSMFGLQTALLARFGADRPEFGHVMNAISGGVVCTVICTMAVGMCLRARARQSMEMSSGEE